MNFAGCNIVDDWVAIVSDSSGSLSIYNDFRYNRRSFPGSNLNISSVEFSRDGVQSGMCNGTHETEYFNMSITAGEYPRFKSMYVSCGLGRNRGGSTPLELRVFDLHSSIVKISTYSPKITTTQSPPTTELPSVLPAAIPALSASFVVAVIVAATAIVSVAILTFKLKTSRKACMVQVSPCQDNNIV